jgi:hypothetical protein
MVAQNTITHFCTPTLKKFQSFQSLALHINLKTLACTLRTAKPGLCFFPYGYFEHSDSPDQIAIVGRMPALPESFQIIAIVHAAGHVLRCLNSIDLHQHANTKVLVMDLYSSHRALPSNLSTTNKMSQKLSFRKHVYTT